jgi:hypothetical protein
MAIKGHTARKRALYVIKHTVGRAAKLLTNFKGRVDIPSEPFILIPNHANDYDTLLVGAMLKQHAYFVASEHVFSWGLAGRLIKAVFNPIARLKGGTAASTVMEMLRRIRDGANICLFAEGNCTWNGLSDAVYPATGKTVRASGATLVTYRFYGDYLTKPRWAKNVRRGKEWGEVVGVYSPEELKAMSADEVNALAELPPREVLVATVLGTLNAPISGLVRVLNANLTGLAMALNAIAEQKAAQ